MLCGYFLLPLPVCSELLHFFVGMIEKHFVRPAKMVEIVIAWIPDAIFGTTAVTVGQPFAGKALLGKICFHPAELMLPLGIQHIDYFASHHISQFPFRFDKKITRVNIAVVFNHYINTACRQKRTFRRC